MLRSDASAAAPRRGTITPRTRGASAGARSPSDPSSSLGAGTGAGAGRSSLPRSDASASCRRSCARSALPSATSDFSSATRIAQLAALALPGGGRRHGRHVRLALPVAQSRLELLDARARLPRRRPVRARLGRQLLEHLPIRQVGVTVEPHERLVDVPGRNPPEAGRACRVPPRRARGTRSSPRPSPSPARRARPGCRGQGGTRGARH